MGIETHHDLVYISAALGLAFYYRCKLCQSSITESTNTSYFNFDHMDNTSVQAFSDDAMDLKYLKITPNFIKCFKKNMLMLLSVHFKIEGELVQLHCINAKHEYFLITERKTRLKIKILTLNRKSLQIPG